MLENLQEGIDASLSYSLRMISDAHMLEADKRFLSAIPLYILALEELGKSQHLIAKHVRRIRVTEEEWRKLTSSPHAHFKKIAVRYADAIKLLTRFTDKEIAGYRAWERQKGLYFPVLPREQMITQYKRALSIIEKLPFVKMACLYVDYYQAKWLSLKTYGSDMLNDICVYLYYESMIMYYSAKLNLFGHTLSLKSKKVTVEKEKAYLENENLFALHVLRSKVHETSFVRAREHAFAVIEVIAAEYKHLARRPTNAI